MRGASSPIITRVLGQNSCFVQGKPRKPEGIIKVIKETRQEALEAARDLLENGMVIATVIADGRVYTVASRNLVKCTLCRT